MSLSRNYIYNMLLTISNMLFPLITFPYVSRVLGPTSLGRVNFVQGVILYFTILAVLGAPNYGIKELAKAKGVNDWNEFKKIFTELFTMSMISSFIGLVILLLSVTFYGKFGQEKALFYIYGAQILFECCNINYLFVVLEDHKRRLIRSLTIRILSLGFLFYYVKTPKDYCIYALILVVPEIIARIIDIFSIRRYFIFKNLNMRRHLKNMILIFLYLFTIGIYGSIDTTMLGTMLETGGKTEVGYYTAAVKMYKLVLAIMLALATVLSPRIIGAIKRKEKKEIYKNMDIYINYCFLIGIPATILMVILSREFTMLFSGGQYSPAIITMMIISPCLFFVAFGTFIGGQIMLPNDLEREILSISIVGVILNIGLNYFLIPEYTRNGAALATLITELLIALFKIYRMKTLYKDYRVLTKERWGILILGGLIGGVLYYFQNSLREILRYDIVILIVIPTIFAILYFILLMITRNKVLLNLLKPLKR